MIMAKDVVRGLKETRTVFCHSSEELSLLLTLPQYSATDRRRRWSFPVTGYLDLSSIPGTLQKPAGSIALHAKSEVDVAKTDLSFMDQYRSFMEEYRPFRSFVVYTSLAQIAVFFYNVILAAKHGFTITWGLDGPYLEVENI